MVGLEIHANAFETIAQRRFLTDVPSWLVLAASVLLVAAAGVIFAFGPLWQAYTLAVVLLVAAHATPYLFFTHGKVFSFVTPVSSAWLATVTAAAWQHLVVRRRLRTAEADRERYQHTMHFITHEMRTPLTAIQGSSELMGRYQMPEEKRKQMAQLINSESKRLGAHDRDLSQRGAALGGADGVEAGDVSGGGHGGGLPGAGASTGGAQTHHH